MKKRNDSKANMRYVNLVGQPEKRWYQKKKRKIQVAVFIGALFVGMIVSLIIPLRPTFSESEKRELAKFPTFSFASFTDGSYFKGIDTWFSDTFPFREFLTTTNSKLTVWYGFGDKVSKLENNQADEIPDAPTTGDDSEQDVTKDDEPESTKPPVEESTDKPTETSTEKPTENTTKPPQQTQTLGGILISGNAAYEYYNFSQAVADSYAKHINYLAKQLKNSGSKAQVYDILVPTSIDITLDEGTRNSINSSNQEKAMKYIYASMSQNVKTVNIYDTLKSHNDEYIYYRTDHHWTALGAYYAYAKFCDEKGIKPVALDKYEEKDYGEFLGSFYNDTNKNKKLEKHADELIAYKPKYSTDMVYTDTKGTKINWPLVHDVSDYPSGYKYSAFAGGDNPFTKVVNNDFDGSRSCVVIKESFGNAMIPFLAGSYKKVYVIDYRTWKGSLSKFVKENNVNDVIFINNMSATRADPLVTSLGNICK